MALAQLEILRGDRYETRITLRTKIAGVLTPYDTVAQNVTPVMQLRDAPNSTGALIATMTIAVSGTDNDVLSVALPATTTLTLTEGAVLYSRLMLRHNADPDLDQITPTDYVFSVRDSATQR